MIYLYYFHICMPHLEKNFTNFILNLKNRLGVTAKLINSKTHEIILNSESNVLFDCY